MKGQRI